MSSRRDLRCSVRRVSAALVRAISSSFCCMSLRRDLRSSTRRVSVPVPGGLLNAITYAISARRRSRNSVSVITSAAVVAGVSSALSGRPYAGMPMGITMMGGAAAGLDTISGSSFPGTWMTTCFGWALAWSCVCSARSSAGAASPRVIGAATSPRRAASARLGRVSPPMRSFSPTDICQLWASCRESLPGRVFTM